MTIRPTKSFSHVRFVAAGAGSGKTYKLTQELETALIEGGVDPARVIATTFTVKAASELRERVRARLIASGRPELAEQMAQALIGTVHSVCERLLTRFAFELGLSPTLRVLALEDGGRLLLRALDEVLDIVRVREMNALGTRLGLVAESGAPKWQMDVRAVVDAARSNDIDARALPAMGRTSARTMLGYFGAPADESPESLDRAFVAALRAADTGLGTVAKQKGSLEYHRRIREAVHDARDGRPDWPTWIALARATAGIRDGADVHAAPVRDAAAAFAKHPQFHRDLTRYLEGVFEIAAASLARFQELKRERGFIDFPDMEQYVLHALADDAVLERLGEELDLLLVDEFQDTNPMQLGLFMRLARVAKRVVFVGDVKQAVFEFRGCDPELVFNTLNELEKRGAAVEVLDRSYRSRPPLVHYVNAVFEPAFAADGMPRKMVVLEPQRNEVLPETPAVVHWHFPARIDRTLLARTIAELVASGVQVVDPDTGDPRAVRWGDIAVLTPTNDQVEALAVALQAERVPMKMTVKGLLSTPEIELAKCCLRRLNDAADTIATAEILSLGRCSEPEEWLADRLRWLDAGKDPFAWAEDSDPVIGKLAMLRGEIATQSPVEVVARVLNYVGVRELVTRWGPDAAKAQQRQRNLDAFLDLAVQYEKRCLAQHEAATLAGFLLWSEAPVSPELDLQPVVTTGDAVHVTTYHKAKGREWPVVIALDVRYPWRTRLFDVRVEAPAQPFDLASPLAGRTIRFWPGLFAPRSKAPALDALLASDTAQAAARASESEGRRLAYVGLTRARDMLVFATQDTDGGYIALPQGDAMPLPTGTIPTAVKAIDQAEPAVAPRTFRPVWFPRREPLTAPLEATVSPSAAAPSAEATIVEVVELGERIAVGEDMNAIGNALHAAIAAELVNPARAREAVARAEALIDAFGAAGLVQASDVVAIARRFAAFVKRRFAPRRILVEHPVAERLASGQLVQGFADVLLETADGWVVIDHKSSPRPRSEWAAEIVSYGGQLAAYASALRASGRTVASTWIHFPVTGAVVLVRSA